MDFSAGDEATPFEEGPQETAETTRGFEASSTTFSAENQTVTFSGFMDGPATSSTISGLSMGPPIPSASLATSSPSGHSSSSEGTKKQNGTVKNVGETTSLGTTEGDDDAPLLFSSASSNGHVTMLNKEVPFRGQGSNGMTILTRDASGAVSVHSKPSEPSLLSSVANSRGQSQCLSIKFDVFWHYFPSCSVLCDLLQIVALLTNSLTSSLR